MHDLTGFQRDLLYVIGGLENPNGLTVKDELEDYYETEVHHGRLYPNLDTLVEKGLVEKGEIDKRTNYYSLTRRGRREIEADVIGRTSTSTLIDSGGTSFDRLTHLFHPQASQLA